MITMELRFRVPAGEEFSDERLEALGYIGIDVDHVSSDMPGVISMVVSAEGGCAEALIEERAEEILGAIPDMDLVDFVPM